jgi:ADP-ribosylglycohydrolase
VVLANGETDGYASLANLAKQLRLDGIELKGCASCARLRFSGMSHQFSGGELGYCTLVGFRDPRGLVRIDHYSGEHTLAAGWPFDLDAMLKARLELSERDLRPSRENAFEGAILGLAIGDALGFPAEFRRRDQILEAFGPKGITGFVALHDSAWSPTPAILGKPHPPGTYSDDTQMSLAIAQAVIAAGEKELSVLMEAMAGRFVEWLLSPDNDRAPGATCVTGCRNLAAGISWRNAGVPDSKGCGSAMRAAPIGLFFWRDHSRLLEVARASSLPTHRHDAAIEGAAAVALLVALALEKKTPQDMYDALVEECAPRSADFRACLGKLPGLLSADPGEALSTRGLGEGWVAEEAVASALYCFWRSPHDFERTVLAAANTDGDSDSIACIAGAISGAFNGLGSIPTRWQEEVENSTVLRDVARRLSEKSK